VIDAGAKLANAQRLMAQGKGVQARRPASGAAAVAGSPELNNAMALVLGALGQLERALYFAQKALALKRRTRSCC
jgi:hypothetical protein